MSKKPFESMVAALTTKPEIVKNPVGRKPNNPRRWQGLTDEDILLAFCYVEYETSNNWVKNPRAWCISNARYLEKILREKNT